MARAAKLSVVLPVHNAQSRIVAEVERVLEAVTELTSGSVELILVDDASHDATPEVLDELRMTYPQVRLARHRRRLGMEAAGQTGLERATGDLVFIQEDDSPICLSDLRQLYRVGEDESVVAARAQSRREPSPGPLLRRLKAWGAAASEELRNRAEAESRTISSTVRGLQMVRRPHLQLLASRGGKQLRLESEHVTASGPGPRKAALWRTPTAAPQPTTT